MRLNAVGPNLRVRLSLGSLLFLVAWLFPATSLPGKFDVSPLQRISLRQAVETTLRRQPEILIQQENVEISRGKFLENAGPFNPAFSMTFSFQDEKTPLDSVERQSYKQSDEEEITAASTLSLSKKTRYGILFKPSMNVVFNDTPFVLTYEDTVYAQSMVNFEIVVPLLKGRGKLGTDSQELAAGFDLEGSELQFEYQVSETVLSTVEAYWGICRAYQLVQIWESLEKSAQELVQMTQKLADADQRPASDINPAEANLAQRIASKISAQRTLSDATKQLGAAMGISPAETARIGLPADAFPNPGPDAPLSRLDDPTSYLETASRYRADLRALSRQEEASRILTAGAKNALLPELNLQVSAGYNGLSDGKAVGTYFKSLSDQLAGPNYSTGFTFSYPLGNDQARGQLIQYMAMLRQTALKRQNLDRTIGINVLKLLTDLQEHVRELNTYRRAVRYYEASVRDEKEKMRLGMSTMNQIFVIEDRLQNSMLSETEAQMNYANNLAQLYFQMGRLITHEGKSYSVDVQHLTDFPQSEPFTTSE